MEDIFTGVGGNHKTQGDYITASSDIFSVVPRDKSTHYGRESVHRPTTENVDGPYEFYSQLIPRSLVHVYFQP